MIESLLVVAVALLALVLRVLLGIKRSLDRQTETLALTIRNGGARPPAP